MATTTPNYGWTVPTSGDLVKDGATAIETLGDAIDASMNTALGTKKAGMVLLNTTSFSGVSSFSLPNNTFTSSYNDYLLLVNFTASSTNLGTRVRLRANGSDETTGAYDRMGFRNPVNSSTVTGTNAAANTLWTWIDVNTTYPTGSQCQILFKSPQTTNAFKIAFMEGTYVDGSGVFTYWSSGNTFSGGTQYDSATVLASTGNFTGNYSVYAFNK